MVMISISNLRIWFGFILLGCFFMAGKSVKPRNCKDAPNDVDPNSKRESVKFPNCTYAFMCDFMFKNSTTEGSWTFMLPEDVKDVSSICTRGSFYTESYGELIYSSKVNSVTLEHIGKSSRNRKNNGSFKKGKYVTASVEYKLSPGNKPYTDSTGGKFKIEILPSCQQDETPWYCVWLPACISIGKTKNVGKCAVEINNIKT